MPASKPLCQSAPGKLHAGAAVLGSAALALLALMAAACSDQSRGDHRGGDVGTTLSDAPLRGFGGDARRLSDLRGKPALINVWASWCGPCRSEMSSLERLSRALDGKLRVVGVSTDDDPRLAQEFLLRSGITFQNFHDADQNLERRVFGAAAIPLTLVVDSRGKVVERVVGAREWDSQRSIAAIEALLGQSLH